jgi:hypothetical protein
MTDDRTFAVTLVKVGPGLPYFEVGAYRYTGPWLPQVGETISVTRVAPPAEGASDELQVFVTRVNPVSDTPISVMEVETPAAVTTDDILV